MTKARPRYHLSDDLRQVYRDDLLQWLRTTCRCPSCREPVGDNPVLAWCNEVQGQPHAEHLLLCRVCGETDWMLRCCFRFGRVKLRKLGGSEVVSYWRLTDIQLSSIAGGYYVPHEVFTNPSPDVSELNRCRAAYRNVP
jgi:hypothetical protein